MRFFYENVIDADGVIVSPSSENAEFPAVNVINQFKGKVWKTENTVQDEYLIFDLGEAKTFRYFIGFAGNILSSDTNKKFEANTSNSWTSPAETADITVDDYGTLIADMGAEVSYRFIRIKFSKGSAGDIRQIGRIFIGTAFEATEPDYGGFKVDKSDLSRVSESVGKQRYSSVREQYRTFKIRVSGIPNTEKEEYEALASYVGTHTYLFLQVGDDNAESPYDEYLYVYFDKMNGYEVEAVEDEPIWKFDLVLEEVT